MAIGRFLNSVLTTCIFWEEIHLENSFSYPEGHVKLYPIFRIMKAMCIYIYSIFSMRAMCIYILYSVQ